MSSSNQGKQVDQGDQGKVSIIIFGMSESSGFQKHSICWVFQALYLCLCLCRCLCHCLCLYFVSSYDFWNSRMKVSKKLWQSRQSRLWMTRTKSGFIKEDQFVTSHSDLVSEEVEEKKVEIPRPSVSRDWTSHKQEIRIVCIIFGPLWHQLLFCNCALILSEE